MGLSYKILNIFNQSFYCDIPSVFSPKEQIFKFSHCFKTKPNSKWVFKLTSSYAQTGQLQYTNGFYMLLLRSPEFEGRNNLRSALGTPANISGVPVNPMGDFINIPEYYRDTDLVWLLDDFPVQPVTMVFARGDNGVAQNLGYMDIYQSWNIYEVELL